MGPDLFRVNALWMYGVIVGLAIEEALERVLPRIFQDTDSATGVALISHEGFRLVVFLVMIVRFYFGAVVYMGRCAAETQRLDFLLGFLHFIIFYFWALTIPVNPTSLPGAEALAALPRADPMPPVEYFAVVLCIVLAYDAFWWLLTQGLRSKPHYMVRIWTIVNLLTLCVVITSYVSVKHVFKYGQWWAEFWPGLVVLIASAIDITELVQNKGIFRRGLLANAEMRPRPNV